MNLWNNHTAALLTRGTQPHVNQFLAFVFFYAESSKILLDFFYTLDIVQNI